MPHISVLIVNYNAGTYLKRCLDALLTQTYQDFDVIIVDNASTDHSLDPVPPDNRIHLLPLHNNIGFAAANNRAAAIAAGTWLALLNPDAFPEKNWLEQLVAATKRYPQYSMFGSTQINAENPALLDGTGDIYHILGVPSRGNYQRPVVHLPETGEVFAPCAAAALYKKTIFLDAGGFDEKFFCYCEDIDLAFRLRLQGQRCLQVKEALVHHVGSGITGKTSAFAKYYGTRNRFWVFFKNMPLALLVPLLPLHLFMQGVFFIKAVKVGYAGAFIRAWCDTLRHFPYLLAARKEVQQQRSLSLFKLCPAFTYSLKKLWERGR